MTLRTLIALFLFLPACSKSKPKKQARKPDEVKPAFQVPKRLLAVPACAKYVKALQCYFRKAHAVNLKEDPDKAKQTVATFTRWLEKPRATNDNEVAKVCTEQMKLFVKASPMDRFLKDCASSRMLAAAQPTSKEAAQAAMKVPECATYIKTLKCAFKVLMLDDKQQSKALTVVYEMVWAAPKDERGKDCAYALRKWWKSVKANPQVKGCKP